MMRRWHPSLPLKLQVGCCCRHRPAAGAQRRFLSDDRCRPPRDKAVYVHGQHTRRYYYVLDTRGQLHLEESPHRNFTSCFKDKAFLSFFYKSLRRNDVRTPDDDAYTQSCPYVSLCGLERNYLTPEDPLAPLVFVDYDDTTNRLLYPADVVRSFFGHVGAVTPSTSCRLNL